MNNSTSSPTDELIKAVMEWGRSHKIFDPMAQYAKVTEEVGEIAHELTRNNLHSEAMEDALGDSLVTILILADILDFNPVDCLNKAYHVIKDRTGHLENGSFIKEEQ